MTLCGITKTDFIALKYLHKTILTLRFSWMNGCFMESTCINRVLFCDKDDLVTMVLFLHSPSFHRWRWWSADEHREFDEFFVFVFKVNCNQRNFRSKSWWKLIFDSCLVPIFLCWKEKSIALISFECILTLTLWNPCSDHFMICHNINDFWWKE